MARFSVRGRLSFDVGHMPARRGEEAVRFTGQKREEQRKGERGPTQAHDRRTERNARGERHRQRCICVPTVAARGRNRDVGYRGENADACNDR